NGHRFEVCMTCTTRDRVRNTATVESAFKDFTELYVKNPNKSREIFPQVAQYMENVWSKAYPQSAKELKTASDSYAEWQKNATPLDLVKSQIKFDRPDSPLQWFKKKWSEIFNKDTWEKNFISKLAPLRKISPQAEMYAEVFAGSGMVATQYL